MKNSSGSYDDVYLRTRVDNILLTDNSTLLSTKLSNMDTAIASKAASSHTHSDYATSSHSHAAEDITSGTLPASRGGTGVTSISALKTALGIGSGGSGKLTYATYTATGTYTPPKSFVTTTPTSPMRHLSRRSPSSRMTISTALIPNTRPTAKSWPS